MSCTESNKKKLPPNQEATARLLRWGIDHPGITSTNPQLKLETYTLTVDGEVENPVTLSWNDFMKLPKTVSISDFHCVEGWSVIDCKWEGVTIREIEKLVKPKDIAKAVTFESADSYTTSLFREELQGNDVLLAYKLNDVVLEEGYGFPVRLVVPSKYAYKSALWVVHLQIYSRQSFGFLGKTGIQRQCGCLEK